MSNSDVSQGDICPFFYSDFKLAYLKAPASMGARSVSLPKTLYRLKNGKADTSTSYTLLNSANAGMTLVSADYVDPYYGTTSFDKYLIMREDATVPNVTFSFTITPGDAVPADVENHFMGIYAGIGTPTISGDAVFTPDDKTIAEANVSADQNVKFATTDNTTDEKFAVKTLKISFADIVFPEPGIYRYKITETANNTSSITADSADTRYLDVYVTTSDTSDTNEPEGFVLHNDATNVTMDTASYGSTGSYTDVKSQGYTNSYTSYDLTISSKVLGNQGSCDKYFKYTVSLTGLGAGNVVNVDLTDADAIPSATQATTYTDMSNPSSITADASGNATVVFYLKNDQNVKLISLAKGSAYTITEDEEDYAPSKAVEGTNDTATANDAVTETAIDSDDAVTFTNTKQGIVPTGIILSIMPAVIGGMAAVGGIGYVTAKKKKHDDED